MKRQMQSARTCLLARPMSAVAVLVAVVAFVAGNEVSGAPSGDKIFAANCQACHAGGKNMIDPKKPIIGSKKLATKDTFKAFLSKAQGTMPAFNKIADNDEALTALHAYVKTLK